jgi:hypothetical protein
MKFQDYLEAKKHKVGAYNGKAVTTPPKGQMPKNAGGSGEKGEPKGYGPKAIGKGIDPNKGKLKHGFSDEGSIPPYNPKTEIPQEWAEKGDKSKTWPKTKMQEWLDAKKKLSLAEFTKSIRDESQNGLSECECQNDPFTSIKETTNLCKCNQKYTSALVREMKRSGVFDAFVSEMFQHPETFAQLGKLMESDEMYARRVVRGMNEALAVSPPMGLGHDDDDEDEDMPHPHHPMHHPMHGHDDMGDMPHPDDMAGGEDDAHLGDEDDLDKGMGDELGGHDDMGDGPPPMPHDKIGKIAPPKKKKPKMHAHHHLLKAMADSPKMGPDMMKGMGGMFGM